MVETMIDRKIVLDDCGGKIKERRPDVMLIREMCKISSSDEPVALERRRSTRYEC